MRAARFDVRPLDVGVHACNNAAGTAIERRVTPTGGEPFDSSASVAFLTGFAICLE
jgi:hypothetical protein